MITPQRFSKTLGKQSLQIGLNFNELFISSLIPFMCSLFELDPLYSIGLFLLVCLLLIIKNRFLEPRYVQNVLERKSHFSWERVKIND